jgi:nucleotide-binding universal stress UspA family protein
MIRHILFPYDCSERGREIVPYVRAFARRFGARVTLLGVVPPTFTALSPVVRLHMRVGEDTGEWKRHLQSELDQTFTDDFDRVAVDRVADAGDPAIRIVEFANDHGVDLIAMPTRGAGPFRSLLIGSVTAKVLHDARCPVWTAAHAEAQLAPELPRVILCAVDGSSRTPALVRWADGLAQRLGARLDLVHVVGPVSDWPSLESERQLQERVRETARKNIDAQLASAGLSVPLHVSVGHIVQTISEEARRACADLVVIGRGAMTEAFGRLRTHAFGVIQQSPCPVVSV